MLETNPGLSNGHRAPYAESGPGVVAFCDISGFTALVRRLLFSLQRSIFVENELELQRFAKLRVFFLSRNIFADH